MTGSGVHRGSLGIVCARLPGVVVADDVGEVGSALLFAGRDGVGVEAGLGGGVDPSDLAPQHDDLAVRAADVRARWMATGAVLGAPAAAVRPAAVWVAQP